MIQAEIKSLGNIRRVEMKSYHGLNEVGAWIITMYKLAEGHDHIPLTRSFIRMNNRRFVGQMIEQVYEIRSRLLHGHIYIAKIKRGEIRRIEILNEDTQTSHTFPL